MIDFYIQLEDIDKAFYYTKKALLINEDSVGYNKRNALLLQTLRAIYRSRNCLSETIQLGNYELEIWIEWMNTLIFPKRMGKDDYHRASSKRVLS